MCVKFDCLCVSREIVDGVLPGVFKLFVLCLKGVSGAGWSKATSSIVQHNPSNQHRWGDPGFAALGNVSVSAQL